MCNLCFDWEKNKDKDDIEPEILSKEICKEEDLKKAFEKMFGKPPQVRYPKNNRKQLANRFTKSIRKNCPNCPLFKFQI